MLQTSELIFGSFYYFCTFCVPHVLKQNTKFAEGNYLNIFVMTYFRSYYERYSNVKQTRISKY